MASTEKFVTNRGKPGLIVDGFKFRKVKFSKIPSFGDALTSPVVAAARQILMI